jgi:hypothetical protein
MVEWWHVAMHQPCVVLTFGPSIVKPLVITKKKAVEKCLKRKIKSVLYSNSPTMARLELWTQCTLALKHYREEGSRKTYKQ